nr:MerR family transcriptional regulator [uncultured Roseateles sp.]
MEDAGLPIAAVELETGLSKDILRVWERRYGFPSPERDAQGERVYGPAQLHKLRLIKRLMLLGHRPGRIVSGEVPALEALLEQARSSPALVAPVNAESHDLAGFFGLLRGHDVDGVRRQLSQWLLRLGLARFVIEVVAPLNTQVGEAWMQRELEVFEEHIYSEAIQSVLRPAIQSIPVAAEAGRPRVLLTTLPGEAHGLGLLMVEALLALEGCQCLSLGTQTPLQDIAMAAAVHRSDVVALSFTGFLPAKQVLEGLGRMRELLPERLELWVGGTAQSLRRRQVPGVRRVSGLVEVGAELGRWRALTAAAARPV